MGKRRDQQLHPVVVVPQQLLQVLQRLRLHQDPGPDLEQGASAGRHLRQRGPQISTTSFASTQEHLQGDQRPVLKNIELRRSPKFERSLT
jgi:hypothetical protein